MIQKKDFLNFSAKVFVLVAITVLSIRLSTLIFGPLPFSINTKTLDKDTTFFVTSDASVFINPDVASVTLSIESNNPTASQAQKVSNQIINKVTEELKKLGVKEQNIKTISYNIYPTYSTDGKRIDSYRAAVSVRVKVNDLDKINEVIDASTANGVNNVSNVTFDIENKDSAVDEARKEAIKKAKDKAQKIASESGVRLGRLVNISEYYPGNFEPMMMDSFGKGMGGGGNATDVQPGQTEIKINVTLSYETY